LWAHAEVEHDARKELAGYLVARLSGKEPVMYEVSTREIPDRTVLCLKRNVQGEAGAWAFGKEFISLIKGKDLLRVEGRTGAMFCIWWGSVNDDSDGPLEWCLPVPGDQVEALATRVPELWRAAERPRRPDHLPRQASHHRNQRPRLRLRGPVFLNHVLRGRTAQGSGR
jgi:hypothetical protein